VGEYTLNTRHRTRQVTFNAISFFTAIFLLMKKGCKVALTYIIFGKELGDHLGTRGPAPLILLLSAVSNAEDAGARSDAE
jgi:hypothetical protein